MRRKQGALVPFEQEILRKAKENFNPQNEESQGDEFYGYEISRQLGDGKSESRGTLYRALERLLKMGYLTYRWRNAPNNEGLRRKYYRITKKAADYQEVN